MNTIPLIATFIILSIGTFTDFKKREVPDWLSYGSIIIGLGISLIISLTYMDFSYILYSILGGIIFTGIAFAMFYMGQWGGGDSKVLMGLGTLIGFNISQVSTQILPDLIQLLFLIMFVGALYGLLWSFFLAGMNSKNFKKKFGKISKSYDLHKKVVLAISTLLVIIALFTPFSIRIILFAIVIAMIPSFYIWLYAKAIEKSSMQRYLPPEKLVEGDWLVEDIKDGKKVIASAKDLGLEKDQIEKIKEMKEQGKLKKVLVREGIPFLPSFLIAFLILVIMKLLGYNLINLVTFF